MQAAGLQRAIALDMLPESKERLVAEREEWPVQGGKDFQLVIGPFDRGESVAESDDLLAIVEGAPTHKNVGDAAHFQRSDVGPCDIRPEIAESAKQNGDVTRPYSDGATLLFDGPTALVQQPGDEGSRGGPGPRPATGRRRPYAGNLSSPSSGAARDRGAPPRARHNRDP